MKSLLSFIKKHEVAILLVGVLSGVISFVVSISVMFLCSLTPEESNFIFSFGIVAFAVGCGVPVLLLGVNK
jgi:hypothetical protein